MGKNKKKWTVRRNGAYKQLLPPRRDYKDALFRMIFNDKEALLSLYNAVGNTSYTDASQLQIVTLENAVYMNIKNDLAFLLNMELNLYEHQSTWNPNMPLRDLFYVSREYEMLLANQSIYSSSLLKLPAPRFVVFFNGSYDMGEQCVLKLSDAYEKKVEDPDLELKVTVLNINAGWNDELMNTCRLLKEYSLYVARVRAYAKEMELAEAVSRAVDECIKEGILRDFLMKYRAEAISVSIFEYDEEREKELLRKTEYEFGRQEGLSQGREEGLSQGIKEGMAQGVSAMIRHCRKAGASREDTLSILMEEFSISKGDAEEYLKKYWK